jgi:hypothetical protein
VGIHAEHQARSARKCSEGNREQQGSHRKSGEVIQKCLQLELGSRGSEVDRTLGFSDKSRIRRTDSDPVHVWHVAPDIGAAALDVFAGAIREHCELNATGFTGRAREQKVD